MLLIGGASGTGKTVVARQLGLHFGVSWLEVDDLRLALQYSHAVLPEKTEALYFFLEAPDIWTKPPEVLKDGLIAVGEVMCPAVEIVVANHVDTVAPVVIEGEGIVPSLFAAPMVRERARTGLVRGVFLVEPEEDALFANMVARGRGIAQRSEAELRTEARSKWLYGQWLAGEAKRYGLPVLHPRPWATLLERIIAEISPSKS